MRHAALAFAALVFVATPAAADIKLTEIGRYATGVFNKSAAEIAAYDAGTRRLFVVNGATDGIDVLDIRDPAKPARIGEVRLEAFGSGVNSVAVHDGLVAAAIAGRAKTNRGQVVFFRAADLAVLKNLEVGHLPDMVVFTPDGRWVLTADEGEPSEDYAIDPEGTVSIIDMSGGVAGLDQGKVRQADFRRFDGQPTPDGFRIARRGVPLSKDVEPEYIAVSADSRTAWVTLQENNGLAIVDIASARVTRLVGFGYKDHRVHPLDPSDRDGGVKIAPWPVFGMYQPDSIARFERNGATYLVTANEGDSRDWKGFSEEKRVAELKLDPAAFPNAEELRKPEALGRLRVTNQLGDTDGDGVFKALYAFGARSFSVWDSEGRLVWDSGDQLERLVAERLPDHFNANHANNKSRDDRSDDKGPEPEGVAVAVVGGVPYAFIGLERIGGVVVYSLADPRQPRFIDWVLNRDFKVEAKEAAAGDLGPEGLMVIPAENAPGGKPILVVTNEVSGTTTLYAIEPR